MLKCFEKEESEVLCKRIDTINAQSLPLWGKMNASQMIKHCTIPYNQIFDKNVPKSPFLMRIMVRLFFKKSMVNETPYKQNLPTAPNFIINETPDIEPCKEILKAKIRETQILGASHFEGKAHSTLGILTAVEWNNVLYKHLDHHLRQFGA